MQLNASSHLIRTANQVGLLDELRERQKTLDEICVTQFLNRDATKLLLDALVAIGIVEQYGDDYALSQAARLLNQYDSDLGDSMWRELTTYLNGQRNREDIDLRIGHGRDTATQWIMTAAAMQVAEMLDVGTDPASDLADGDDDTATEIEPANAESVHSETSEIESLAGPANTYRVLDLGCGAGVWSAALAHRGPRVKVTAVDYEECLPAAHNTFDSIGLTDRVETIAADPLTVTLPDASFDLAIIGGRLHDYDDDHASELLTAAMNACRIGGSVVVVDRFDTPNKRTSLTDAIAGLRMALSTPGGRVRSLEETRNMFERTGLRHVEFSYLTVTRGTWGLARGKVVDDGSEASPRGGDASSSDDSDNQ